VFEVEFGDFTSEDEADDSAKAEVDPLSRAPNSFLFPAYRKAKYPEIQPQGLYCEAVELPSSVLEQLLVPPPCSFLIARL
jgi:hypothetical protein